MNKITCYLNSNYIDIKKNNNITHLETNSILNGDIIDSKLFINDVKKLKLFSNILTNNVEILLNHLIEEKDYLYYKNIFEDLNCNKISLKDTSKKINNNTLIECIPNYILYHDNNYIKLEPNILEYYLSINDIKLLNIISINKLDNNKKCKYYYYNNSNNYFLN